jgi:hypothetical protein
MSNTPWTDALERDGLDCAPLYFARTLERELSVEQEQHNRTVELAIARKEECAKLERELSEAKALYSSALSNLGEMMTSRDQWKQCAEKMSVWPSRPSEEALAHFNQLKGQDK